MIKVSVIIPIYNVENYIEECLQSAMRQTLSEIEIICVNDGTKDCSMDIVEKYAQTDSRIVIVHKENGGLSSARNMGIEHAVGEYLYFLDSDDYITDNMLETLYAEVKKHQLDNIYFDAEAFYENEEVERKNRHYRDYYRRPGIFEEPVSGQELFARMENLGYYRPSACLQMPKRSLIVENHISFYEGIIHEDQLFSLQVILSAKRVKHLAVPFYKRRVRAQSIMTGAQEFKSSYGYYVCLSEFNGYIRGLDLQSQELERAVKRRLHALQNLSAKAIETISYEELDKELQSYPLEVRLEYGLLVKRLVEERQIQAQKRTMQRKKLEGQLASVKKSASFRLGNNILRVPRKLIRMMKNIRQKGIICTLYGVKRRLAGEKRELGPDRLCVSVIIPMYNAQKYLRECLDCLMHQTLKSIEIICVNDGSTDATLSILEEYAKKDGRIRIISQKNQGAGIARNTGIENAGGEYYLFLDADDIYHEKLCEEAYYRAKYDMADIVLFEASRYNVQTGKKEEMNWVLKEELLPEKIPFSIRNAGEKIYQITTACPWSKMFRAEFVKEQGLEFQNTKNANDVFFVRTALAAAKRITVLKKCLITYRYNDGGNLQSGKQKAPIEFYKAFKALKEELIKRKLYDRVERSFVNMVLKESLFNWETAGSVEARTEIEKVLLKEGFDFFEFHKYNKEFFYDEKMYKAYKQFGTQRK